MQMGILFIKVIFRFFIRLKSFELRLFWIEELSCVRFFQLKLVKNIDFFKTFRWLALKITSFIRMKVLGFEIFFINIFILMTDLFRVLKFIIDRRISWVIRMFNYSLFFLMGDLIIVLLLINSKILIEMRIRFEHHFIRDQMFCSIFLYFVKLTFIKKITDRKKVLYTNLKNKK